MSKPIHFALEVDGDRILPTIYFNGPTKRAEVIRAFKAWECDSIIVPASKPKPWEIKNSLTLLFGLSAWRCEGKKWKS